MAGGAQPRLILVGRVAGAFGVRGEVRITAYTEAPQALARYGGLLGEDGAAALTIVSGRPQKGALIARVREVETREAAEALKGLALYIPRDALPEPEADEFYLADLIGLEARNAAGAVIGQVKSVQNFGAGDLLEIAPTDGSATWWLPFTREAVPDVRIAEGWVTAVRPPEAEEGEGPEK